MNRIEYKQFKEVFYEDTCDNGLKVVVWHKPLFKSTSCLFGTPFGSFDLQQKTDNDEYYRFKSGIAHFLEHKLFESEEGDILSKFSELGANVNAFTSYQETAYYFNTSDEDIETPLNLLMDFVQDLSITEESVEKEKGIITQELMMYLQNPDSRLYFESFKSMYHSNPLKEDIGGSPESVALITKEELEECYNLNYHPANMTLIIVTPMDPERIFKIVKENQSKKTFDKFNGITRLYSKEPEYVVEEIKEINMDISETKCSLGIKLPVIKNSDEERVKKDWALNFSLEAYFSSMNPKYQNWLDEKKITPYFNVMEDIGREHSFILFTDNHENPKEFKDFVLKELNRFKNTYISEKDLKTLKNRTLGQLLRGFNNLESISVGYFRDSINGVSSFSSLNIVQNLSVDDCMNEIKDLDFSNNSLTIIKSSSN